jgi:hypothetical protein
MKGTFRITQEIELDYREFINSLLCDGLYPFGDYGFELGWDKEQYKLCRDKVEHLVLEEVQTQMILDGYAIKFIDVEGGGEHNADLTLSAIDKALWKFLGEEPKDDFILCFNRIFHGEYDMEDCELVLQYILFGEYTFA